MIDVDRCKRSIEEKSRRKFTEQSEESYDQVEEISVVNLPVWFDLILWQEQLNFHSFLFKSNLKENSSSDLFISYTHKTIRNRKIT